MGSFLSSIKYKFFKEGRAIKINKKEGRIVQMVSISCPSLINLLKFLVKNKETTKYNVKIVIVIRTIIVWSWKKRMCSIEGEDASWKDKAIQIGIKDQYLK